MKLIENDNYTKKLVGKLNGSKKDYTELENKISNEIDKYLSENSIEVTDTDDLVEALEDFVSDELIYYMDKTGEELTFEVELKNGEIKVNVFSV